MADRHFKKTADRYQRGFTLVELLVVVFIIGILATVVTVSSTASRAQARDTQRKSDLSNVAAALEIYRATNKRYPDIQSRSGSWANLKTVLFPDYINPWPTDPKDSTAHQYTYISNDPSLGPVGKFFALDVALENKEEKVTSTETIESGNTQSATFLTGTFLSTIGDTNGFVIYRVAGR